MATSPDIQELPPIEKILATELSVTREQVWSAIKLLDNGATVPFIARYRKEATGGLTDTHLRMLSDRLEYLRELEKRRIDVLQSIEDQGKLTDTLKNSILKASTKAQLEDIYLPFRPKRGSKAQAARDMGLTPLADKLWKDPSLDPFKEAALFVNVEKNVPDVMAALSGAKEILMERFTDDTVLVGVLREKFWKEGWIVSSKSKTKALAENAETYRDYFDFREAIAKIPSHRVLAILRGRRESVLDVSFLTQGYAEYSGKKEDTEREYIQAILDRFSITPRKRASDGWLLEAVQYAWKYKIRLRLEMDIVAALREKAEEEAIKVFSQNLRSLLLAAPAGSRVTMGLDPGFRTGVKVAVVDATGRPLEVTAIYPHAPQEEWKKSTETLTHLILKHQVELIAIGNGTASRETDTLVIELLKQMPGHLIQKIVVSEAGASVYSASELASFELPDMDVSYRGAVSIARRLQDPLAELVKIDPKSIGVGQYQHDVNQARLAKMLKNVVEDCVNAVGVDANTASSSLLSYVSGLTKRTAEQIVQYRNNKGLFQSRLEFLKIPDFGQRTFEQAAGFLRILDGQNPLEASAVHPEAYPVVEKILSRTGKRMSELVGNPSAIQSLVPDDFVDDRFGLPTVEDILEELEKPGRDPRPEFKTASFRQDVTRIEDLKPGMSLEGTVTNVANFGAFVDIGVHTDGLVHISELSDSFVKDPQDVVKTGKLVKVKVLDVDIARRRISLSMRSGAKPKSASFIFDKKTISS